jgi:hypothetical protein
MRNKYPGAHFLAAKAEVVHSEMTQGETKLIFVTVRFETRDRFDTVYSWFKAHPGKIHVGENPFPEVGLSEVEITRSGNTVFEVTNFEESDKYLDILSRLMVGEFSFGEEGP